MSLTLPREAVSVPLARHLLASTLERTGVAQHVIDDVKVALTEACTNAYQHVEAGDTYEIRIILDDESLVIDVVDWGTASRLPTTRWRSTTSSRRSARVVVDST